MDRYYYYYYFYYYAVVCLQTTTTELICRWIRGRRLSRAAVADDSDVTWRRTDSGRRSTSSVSPR